MIADQLTSTFAALADPTRRAILERLAGGEATVTQLAEPFAISLPAVTKHLKVLRKAGLISQGRDGQRRPCRLETERLRAVAGWVERYRGHWELNFERLDAYLKGLPKGEVDDGQRGGSGQGGGDIAIGSGDPDHPII